MLFADLSGYTAVSERLDPERIKSLVDRALRRLGEEVERYGGTIDKYIGDNVMGVFGAPVSHEDDPERAVRAALAMQAAMDEINERIAADIDASFALRVGINSGDVLAGRVGDGYTVIGDPVNVAARLQAAAEPGTVIVGETHPPPDPVGDRVRRARAARAEGQVRAGAGLGGGAGGRPRPRRRAGARTSTPLVGRDDESELLLCALRADVVREQRPHLVTVLGQAGVGKSRLLRELAARVGELEPPARRPARQLPRLRRRARLLGARRDRPRDLRDRRHRRRATPPGASSAAGSTSSSSSADTEEPPSGSRPRSAGRSASSPPAAAGAESHEPRGPAADARPALLGRPHAARGGGPARSRWSSRSRTSTGPTRGCST